MFSGLKIGKNVGKGEFCSNFNLASEKLGSNCIELFLLAVLVGICVFEIVDFQESSLETYDEGLGINKFNFLNCCRCLIWVGKE